MYYTTKEVEGMWSVKKIRHWTIDGIRRMCIENNLYTRGDNKDYQNLMSYVSDHVPTMQCMFWVARDIFAHSKFNNESLITEPLSHIMWLIEHEAVITTYSVEMRDD